MQDRVADGRFAEKQSAKKGRQTNGQFAKGHPGGPGRPKGVPNKITRQVKEWLQVLVNSSDVQDAIEERIKKGDAVAFFRALEHVVGKPTETINARLEHHIYEWGKR